MAEEQQWQPPSYATEEWKPPEYAQEEEGILSKIASSPTTKKVLRWLSTGDPREPDPNRARVVTGMEHSLLPEMQHNPDDGWPAYIGKGLYNTLIQPLGSGPGIIGASQPQSLAEFRLAQIGKQVLEKPSEVASSIPNIVSKAKIAKGEINPRSGEKLPQEISDLRNKLINTPPKPEIPNQPQVNQSRTSINELINAPKTIMASTDLSAPLRQGMPLIYRKEWWTSLDDMVKAFGSENAFNALDNTIKEMPSYPLMKQAKLALTAIDGPLTNKEEAFLGGIVEKIPIAGRVIRASDRAYTGFLNKLRADTFNSLLNDATKIGHDPNVIAPDIAKFVNTSTGRGSLGSLEKVAVELNTVLFSPRMIASRLTMMNPKYYVDQPDFLRKEALKALLSLTTAGATFAGLTNEVAKKLGYNASVSTDPTNTDFGKVKIGNTRIDPYAGFQQYVVAASRLYSGESTSSVSGKTTVLGEGFRAPTRMDVLTKFGENKLSPVASFIDTMLRGKGQDGKPVNFSKEVRDRFTPMVVQDLIDIYKDDPSLLPLGITGILGMGMQTYK